MRKRVTVVFAEGSFGCGSDVAENEVRGRLGRYSLKVGAVPSGNGRCEETRRSAKLGVGVEAYAKTVCIVLTATCVLKMKP